jgi:hypothetical protein
MVRFYPPPQTVTQYYVFFIFVCFLFVAFREERGVGERESRFFFFFTMALMPNERFSSLQEREKKKPNRASQQPSQEKTTKTTCRCSSTPIHTQTHKRVKSAMPKQANGKGVEAAAPLRRLLSRCPFTKRYGLIVFVLLTPSRTHRDRVRSTHSLSLSRPITRLTLMR